MNKKFKLTEAGLQKYQDELKNLKEVERLKNIQDLKDARAQGDLSENADYDAARDRQREIEERIKELEIIIKNHEIISDNELTSNLGKTVSVLYEGETEPEDFTIVGSLESNPMSGKISNESPLGQAILLATIGDIVTVKTETTEFKVKVVNIK